MKKKGVSPLIATVLLLAFAVALATVIMQLDIFGKCKLANVQVLEIGGTQKICYNDEDGQIEMFIENRDKNDIAGFRVTVTGENKPMNIEHIGVPVQRNAQEKLIFKYDRRVYGDILGMAIYPKLNQSNKFKECEITKQVREILPCK